MSLRIARWMTGLCLLAASQAHAAGDVAAGKEKAEICTACHGEQTVPDTADVPALAGQNNNYLQWQLIYFREGRRKNEVMSPLAQDLTDKDVRNLGAYFASLPRPPAPTKDLADASLIETGKKAVADHRMRRLSHRHVRRRRRRAGDHAPAPRLSDQGLDRLSRKRASEHGRWGHERRSRQPDG